MRESRCMALLAAIVVMSGCGSVAIPGRPSSTASAGIGAGELAVADWQNGRVLIFGAPFTNGESASIVLGQPDFTSSSSAEMPNTLFGPSGIARDRAGNLYVSQFWNLRVARFGLPLESGMDASLEVGAPGWTTSSDGSPYSCLSASPSSLCMPASASVDQHGDLWVADTFDGRVVEYQPPITQAMTANLAIGHTSMDDMGDCNGISDWDHGGPAPPPTSMTATLLCRPEAAVIDSNGNLWIADSSNERVLEYLPPFSTGMPAVIELGFPSGVGMTAPVAATNCNAAASASPGSLCAPMALALDMAGDLWVTDTGNNRVLEFMPPFSSGMAATLVIGQQDFSDRTIAGVGASTLNAPDGLTFDSDGNLIVADGGNNRVLVFVPPFTTGMSASVVIGQSTMTSGSDDCSSRILTANTLCGPWGVLAFPNP